MTSKRKTKHVNFPNVKEGLIWVFCEKMMTDITPGNTFKRIM